MLVAKNNSFVIRMKRFAAILFLTFVLIELMAVTPAGAWFRVEALPVHDSVEFRVKKDEGKAVRGRMSHSAYPVVRYWVSCIVYFPRGAALPDPKRNFYVCARKQGFYRFT